MNGLDWDKELQGSLAATFKAADVDSAYEVSRELVGKLGDQFTRLLSPADASKFLNAEKGQVRAAPRRSACLPVFPACPHGATRTAPRWAG